MRNAIQAHWKKKQEQFKLVSQKLKISRKENTFLQSSPSKNPIRRSRAIQKLNKS